jgi:phosphoglycerate kinase
MKAINSLQISGKRVFIRVDVNVPLDDQKNITDDTRIREALPTLEYALKQGAKVIVASHLGRPEGKVSPEFSLSPVAQSLQRYLKRPVQLANDCIGDDVSAMISKMQPKDVILLENLRFHPEEEKNDDSFAQKLAGLCDVYVNDAFAVSHRKNASVEAITRFAHQSAAGFLLEKEINYFEKAMKKPDRPLVAIVGGAKVSTKLAALDNMMNQVDTFIIGGAMANTFLAGLGYDMGKSKIESGLIDTARNIMEKAARRKVKFYLPVDVVAADRFDVAASLKTTPVQEVPSDWMALDIGPASSLLFSEILADAKTVVWNGPLGAFEMPCFASGTMAVANTLAGSKALTIVGGGDTVAAVYQSGQADKMSYISTGGGAFLELLEGKSLPGVDALK